MRFDKGLLGRLRPGLNRVHQHFERFVVRERRQHRGAQYVLIDQRLHLLGYADAYAGNRQPFRPVWLRRARLKCLVRP